MQRILLAASGAVSLLIGCVSLSADYPARDSERQLSNLSRLYWVDDQRLVFAGFNGREVVRGDGYRVRLQSIYLWDTQTGKVDDLGETGTEVCYANGYLAYRAWESGNAGTELGDVMGGPLGSPAKVDASMTGRPLDYQTCKPHAEALIPDWTKGKKVWRLKSGDFFILGDEKDERNTPVTFHPNGARQGVVMPFRSREFFFPGVTYYEFKGAYFIVGEYFVTDLSNSWGGFNKHPWPTGMPIPVWWLYPDGRVEEIKLPTEARFAAMSAIFPARTGIYYVSLDFPRSEGLYRVSSESIARRILSGWIENYAISPDGCRIAVNHNDHDKYDGKRGLGTAKAVNICANGE